MSERPDWTECLYRPSMLCGEKHEKLGRGTGTVDMGEVMREMWLAEARPASQPQDGQPEAEEGRPQRRPFRHSRLRRLSPHRRLRRRRWRSRYATRASYFQASGRW